jgi:SAM-dependent methyltransferase
MPKPILDPAFWRERLASAKEPHHAIFVCPGEQWRRIEAKHREILARTIGPADSVLDAGCGWGRLLGLMPEGWGGYYLGVDLSPDFIAAAKPRAVHQRREFYCADLRDLDFLESGGFDWAVAVSVRPMVRRELGEETWRQMERELRRVARRRLYLEYDPDCEGFVE